MEKRKMRLKFWGVRGSIPCPGPQTVRYGGNTPCLELRVDDRLLIIDAGSGIRELGDYLMAHDRQKGAVQAQLYLSHTHWDHIMGFPFFTPAYLPDTRLEVFGPVTHEEESLESIVTGQMTYHYFPIRGVELAAQMSFHTLKEGEVDLGGGLTLTSKYLNHPVLCLGYRFAFGDKVICTAYDTEPFRNLFCTDPDAEDYDPLLAAEGEQVAVEQNQAVTRFFTGADVLIQDAQYTPDEYQNGKQGWGHTHMDYACEAAITAGVKELVLFHHDPLRNDAELDRLSARYQQRYGDRIAIRFAHEGLEIVV